MPDQSFHFEVFTLDLARLRLDGPSGPINLRPKAFEVLRHLVENAGRVVSKDEIMKVVWPGVTVTDESLTHCIREVRRALGDTAQRMIRTSRKRGYLFDAAVTSGRNGALPASHAAMSGGALIGAAGSKAPLTSEAAVPRQAVHFCTASDGVRIAYATVGDGPPLVKTANWLSHLEYDWESPLWSHLLHALAAEHRLIRYDQRGTGLSDWAAEDISFEAFVRDLDCVVDATGIDRFPLVGISQGCAASIAYAVRHPERVSHLVLYGGFARGSLSGGAGTTQFEALATLIQRGWGQENPAFRQIFTSQLIPGGTLEQAQWFNDLQRITASPQNAVRIMRAMATIDVTELLPRVQAPTLVLHVREDAAVPLKEGRLIATGIPGARFVALDGRNHSILKSDPAWPRFVDEIRTFLAS